MLFGLYVLMSRANSIFIAGYKCLVSLIGRPNNSIADDIF